EWQAAIHSRVAGRGCPYCTSRRVTASTSLRKRFPRLAAEWHPTKNDPLTPDVVTPGSNRAVWWRCPAAPEHEWQAQVAKRTSRGDGCPYCAGQRVMPSTSLAARYPEIAAQWHRTKNAPLTPDAVAPGANRKVWWRCPRNRTHEWETQVSKRTSAGR